MSDFSIGCILALAATLAWGLVVIPVKNARSPGSSGIAYSMPSGLLILFPAAMYGFYHSPAPVLPEFFSRNGFFIIFGGIFQFPLATICYYEAIRSAEISAVAPLKCLKSMFVVFLVFFIGIESISLKTFIACVIGATGAFILTRSPENSPESKSLSQNASTTGPGLKKGIILVLFACLFWSLGDIMMNQAVQHFSSLVVTPLSLFAGMIVFYTWIAVRNDIRKIARMPRHDKLCYVIHGTVSFGIGYCAFFAAMNYIGISKTVIITSAWPLVSFLVGLVLYKESLNICKAVGVGLLVLSVYLIIGWA